MTDENSPDNTSVGESDRVAANVEGEVHAEHTVAQHEHGADCGHEAVEHEGHVDYAHDGHKHFLHGDHYDEH